MLQEDENIIVLEQSVKFSGYRIFTLFIKTNKFHMNEVGFEEFPDDAKEMGYMSESISVSFGDYVSY